MMFLRTQAAARTIFDVQIERRYSVMMGSGRRSGDILMMINHAIVRIRIDRSIGSTTLFCGKTVTTCTMIIMKRSIKSTTLSCGKTAMTCRIIMMKRSYVSGLKDKPTFLWWRFVRPH